RRQNIARLDSAAGWNYREFCSGAHCSEYPKTLSHQTSLGTLSGTLLATVKPSVFLLLTENWSQCPTFLSPTLCDLGHLGHWVVLQALHRRLGDAHFLGNVADGHALG